MSIIVSEPIAGKGKADAERHHEKQEDAFKKNLREIISEESIIKGDTKGRIVKIPIRSLNLPRFRPTKSQRGGGIGQGSGKPGDILGTRPQEGQGQGPGKIGDRPGIDYIDGEVQIEKIIEWMLEDWGLPNLDEKSVKQVAISSGYRIRGISNDGTPPLQSRRETAKQGIKRFHGILAYLVEETGKDELTCFRALKQTDGAISDAFELLKNIEKITVTDEEVTPFPIIFNEDRRFFKLEEQTKTQSNAVIIAMMDISGSMGLFKKYLSRSALFWLVHYLRHLYDNLEIRFIVHHTEARLVEEEEFFEQGESGGTMCSSAYNLANHLIDTEYSPQLWNTYVLHFSDGDNYQTDNDTTVVEISRLLEKQVNMIGYAEVGDEGEQRIRSTTLWNVFIDGLNLTEGVEEGIHVIVGDGGVPFLGVSIENKQDLWPALQIFLLKTRWR